MKAYSFLEEARDEFLEETAYLDLQAEGLGTDFVNDVEAAVRTIP